MIAVVLGYPIAAWGQAIGIEQRSWTDPTLRPSGQPVVPIFEGWYRNEDGSADLCFGYFNLNTEEALEVPLGAGNFLSPEEFDGGQPSHFRPVPGVTAVGAYRRDHCVFTVNVPPNFGPNDRVVWTIESKLDTLSVPGHLLTPYFIDEVESVGTGSVAPMMRIGQNGEQIVGRAGAFGEPLTVRVNEPVELIVSVEHPGETVTLVWAKHQGPGTVFFEQGELIVENPDARGTTVATLTEPGEYVLRVQAIDSVTQFEYHCCWTNAFVQVTVVP